MNGGESHSVDRILVALNASERNYDALELAAEFAALLEVHLTALFVEDVNLLKLAELPFAKELDRSSGVMRRLEPGSVKRTLQSDAHKVEQRLSEESQKRRISASMKVVRGHYVSAAREMAQKSDIVVLDYTTGPYRRVTGSRSSVDRRRIKIAEREPVWVFYDGSETTVRGLDLASRVSYSYGSGLIIVLGDNADEKELRARIDRSPSDLPRSWYQVLLLSEHDRIARILQARGCAVLILPRELKFEDEAVPVLDQIRRPRILV